MSIGQIRLKSSLRSYLIAGLLVTLPLLVTYLLLSWLFTTLDNILQPFFVPLLGSRVPGLGLVAGVLVVLAVGIVAENVIGRRVIERLERVLLRIPLARTIYGSIRDFSQTVLGERRTAFKQVVLLEWPRPGIFAIGFITGAPEASERADVVHVFVPGTPNPTGGFVVLTAREHIRVLDISIEEALRFTISGGTVGTPAAVLDALERPRIGVSGPGEERP